MTYTVLYNDNGLIGITNEEVQSIPGVSYLVVNSALPDLNVSKWDNELLQFMGSVTQLTKREFLSRFSLPERSAIRTSTDDIVMDLMFLLDAATYVDLTDESLIQGVQYLSLINLIQTHRVQEILGDS